MSTTPEFTLELPDSEVRHLVWHGPDLHLSLAAACVIRVDAATGEVEQGYLRGVELHLHQAQADGLLTDALGRLRQGRVLDAGGIPLALTVPATLPGGVRLELNFANGTSLLLLALGLEVQAAPDGEFFPSLAC